MKTKWIPPSLLGTTILVASLFVVTPAGAQCMAAGIQGDIHCPPNVPTGSFGIPTINPGEFEFVDQGGLTVGFFFGPFNLFFPGAATNALQPPDAAGINALTSPLFMDLSNNPALDITPEDCPECLGLNDSKASMEDLASLIVSSLGSPEGEDLVSGLLPVFPGLGMAFITGGPDDDQSTSPPSGSIITGGVGGDDDLFIADHNAAGFMTGVSIRFENESNHGAAFRGTIQGEQLYEAMERSFQAYSDASRLYDSDPNNQTNRAAMMEALETANLDWKAYHAGLGNFINARQRGIFAQSPGGEGKTFGPLGPTFEVSPDVGGSNEEETPTSGSQGIDLGSTNSGTGLSFDSAAIDPSGGNNAGIVLDSTDSANDFSFSGTESIDLNPTRSGPLNLDPLSNPSSSRDEGIVLGSTDSGTGLSFGSADIGSSTGNTGIVLDSTGSGTGLSFGAQSSITSSGIESIDPSSSDSSEGDAGQLGTSNQGTRVTRDIQATGEGSASEPKDDVDEGVGTKSIVAGPTGGSVVPSEAGSSGEHVSSESSTQPKYLGPKPNPSDLRNIDEQSAHWSEFFANILFGFTYQDDHRFESVQRGFPASGNVEDAPEGEKNVTVQPFLQSGEQGIGIDPSLLDPTIPSEEPSEVQGEGSAGTINIQTPNVDISDSTSSRRGTEGVGARESDWYGRIHLPLKADLDEDLSVDTTSIGDGPNKDRTTILSETGGSGEEGSSQRTSSRQSGRGESGETVDVDNEITRLEESLNQKYQDPRIVMEPIYQYKAIIVSDRDYMDGRSDEVTRDLAGLTTK